VDSPGSVRWHVAAIVQDAEKHLHAPYDYERNSHKGDKDREHVTGWDGKHSSLLFSIEGRLGSIISSLERASPFSVSWPASHGIGKFRSRVSLLQL
jgi:hypothetical protein